MGKLVLYYTVMSAPCRAVLLLIKELGLDVVLEKVDFASNEHLAEDYVKMNPQHTVPLLLDDEYRIWDSHAIIIYLINEYAPDSKLLPKDAKQNATVMQRLFFDANVFEKLKEIVTALFQHRKDISKLKLELQHIFEFLEKFLEGSKWFAGDELTIADLSILATFSTIYYCGFKLDEYPALLQWYKSCSVLKGYAENEKNAPLLSKFVKDKVPEGF